ncbi:MAG: Txe/YoeB family addiction module toxin [Sphingobacteriales bacterium]|nr:Txe/YoeB family addiction module toxin [Sphingobacteriales bacterium]
MRYKIEITQEAQKHFEFHKSAGNSIITKKIYVLLTALTEHPFRGVGKPEPLKYNLSGLWSRRINKEHRLVYQVKQETVIIYSAFGHYLL